MPNHQEPHKISAKLKARNGQKWDRLSWKHGGIAWHDTIVFSKSWDSTNLLHMFLTLKFHPASSCCSFLPGLSNCSNASPIPGDAFVAKFARGCRSRLLTWAVAWWAFQAWSCHVQPQAWPCWACPCLAWSASLASLDWNTAAVTDIICVLWPIWRNEHKPKAIWYHHHLQYIPSRYQ